jgi:hypothetical protein
MPLMDELSKWGIKIVASCEERHREYAATYIPGIGSPRQGLMLTSGEIVLEVPQEKALWDALKKPSQYQFSVSIHTPDQNPKMPQTNFNVTMRSPALNGLQFSASSIHEAVEGAKTALIAHHLVKGKQPFSEKSSNEYEDLSAAPTGEVSRRAREMEIYLVTLVSANLRIANNRSFSYETKSSVLTSVDKDPANPESRISVHFDVAPLKGEFARIVSSARLPDVARLSLSFLETAKKGVQPFPVSIQLKSAAGVYQTTATSEQELKKVLAALCPGIKCALW